jgi:hypothetical protein
MIRTPLAAACLFVSLAATCAAQAPSTVSVLVETSDGSLLAGTVASDTPLTVSTGAADEKTSLGHVRRLALSAVSRAEAAELEESANSGTASRRTTPARGRTPRKRWPR